MKTELSKVKKKSGLIIVNFGGPRSLDEIPSFLKSLLCDQDVIRTGLVKPLHRFLFSKIAQKRAKKVQEDYESIGGKSPIYEDTQAVAQKLGHYFSGPILTFHRYLPATHPSFIRSAILHEVDEWKIFPMFPQFSYATTGSIARWFSENLPAEIYQRFNWIKSYPEKEAFTDLFSKRIRSYIENSKIAEDDWLLFFSAHGVPKKFVDQGDPYQYECELSYQKIVKNFPKAQTLLAYQSKFGPGEWLRPYTVDVCEKIDEISKKKHVLFVPLAFTSDHIETLFEIEQDYIPIIKEKGYSTYRLPAFNDEDDWVETINEMISEPNVPIPNLMLIRQ